MIKRRHFAGISIVALTVAAGAPALAQEALPEIEVGAARSNPPAASAPAPAPAPQPSSDQQEFDASQQAASAKYTSGQELNATPFSRPGEALENAVPGLLVTQHSGEGKANQYQLRGFQLDHGTDLALTLDGMPLNMPTHGHGQGYADANFLIPELISSVVGRKGPYYADEGDFAAAGAIHIQYKDTLEDGLFSATGGSFDYARLLGAKSVPFQGGNLLSVLELGTYNGPWTAPDEAHRINGVLRWTQGTQENGFSLTAMAYANRWHASNQIPERAVTEGVISLWGNIDPTDRGDTTRFSLSGRWSETDAKSHTRVEAYAIHTTLDLYNNFDYFLTEPLLGDQFRQFDRRTILGMQAEHGWNYEFAGFPVETRIGVNSRYDDIRVGLQDTYQRMAYATLTNDLVAEGNVGVWTDTTVHWAPWLRTVTGVRGDLFAASIGDYQNPLAAPTGAPFGTPGVTPIWTGPWNSGKKVSAIDSPKASIILGPWQKTEFFLNFGEGFHSTDARGAVTTLNPPDGSQSPTIPLLVKARGAEIGARTKFVEGLDTTISFWWLDFDSENQFDGDTGTTLFGRPSRRYGIELTNHYSPAAWLHFDGDLAISHSRSRGVDQQQALIWAGLVAPGAANYFTYLGNAPGNYIPEAPSIVASVGVEVGKEFGWFGGLKYRFKGAYPLTEDGYFRAPATGWLNLRGGYRWENGLRLQADVFNALGAKSDQISYAYGSLLPTDPLFAPCVGGTAPAAVCAIGQMDRHFKPMEPTAVRVTLSGPMSAGALDPIFAPKPNAHTPWKDFVALAYDEPEATIGGLPSKKGPLLSAPSTPAWTGLYFGLNAGVGFGGNNNIHASTAPIGPGGDPAAAALGNGDYGESNAGFIGGGQIGYNYRISKRTVVGVETDIQGTIGGSGTSTLANAGGSALVPGATLFSGLNSTQRLDWIGTARARAGYLFLPNALLYATGGLAYGQTSLATGIQTFSVNAAGVPTGFSAASGATSPTRVGWTVGGGVEFMFWNNWSVKGEYLHYNLGDLTVMAPQTSWTAGVVAGNLATQFRGHADGQMFRAGLNYHFDWGASAPVIAKY